MEISRRRKKNLKNSFWKKVKNQIETFGRGGVKKEKKMRTRKRRKFISAKIWENEKKARKMIFIRMTHVESAPYFFFPEKSPRMWTIAFRYIENRNEDIFVGGWKKENKNALRGGTRVRKWIFLWIRNEPD